ncbi:MAG: HAMP domain-containing histidine kinase [Bacteroidales bacterium]|nr:HAMP domain-containing histidine kinase [Bacteroidales bacterium]
MNRKALIGIIIIMTIALIGLLGVQLYWIRSASSVKEASFRRSVNEAMAKVVYKLERLEKRRAAEINPFPGMLSFNKHLDYSLFITPYEMDSLISLELNIRGVDTRYQFGIYKPEQDYFIMEKSSDYRKQLIQIGYAYPLFSYDMFTTPEYLLIYFPYERQFLLTELWGMLLISIVLIVVIVYTFSYTITILIRQKKISDMKSDFINNMTHEFKTPISTISLACEALEDKELPRSKAFYDNYIEMIREENSRLSILSERILQAAVLEKGELKMYREMVDLHAVIRDVMKNIRIQVEIKDGDIHTNLRAKPSQLEGDKVHLTNLVYNLLDNATKYTPRRPDIRIRTENSGQGITLSIQDNGTGISKHEQKKIFDKLYRIPTGNIHNVRGFGLGLSYVKAIVGEHHGKITIDSEMNKGTLFKIYLPYKIPD